MSIVSAGMHLPRVERSMGERIQFFDGQRIHVCPQSDHSPGCPSPQNADYTRFCQASMDLDAMAFEILRNHIGGPNLLEA